MPETWAVAIITFLGTALVGVIAYIWQSSQRSVERAAERGDGAVSTIRAIEARLDGHDREFGEVKREQAQCDGRVTAAREEMGARIDRAVSRIDTAERRQGEHESTVNSALARIDATLNNLKESMDRLAAAENANRASQHQQHQSGGLGEFRNLIEMMHLLSKMPRLPEGAHA